MSESNPYAPPQVGGPMPLSAQSTDGVWRDGNILVMHKQAVLPDRCVKCNTPASGMRLRRNLSWHHPAYFLIVLAGLLIYVIVALCVRQRAKIDIGICEAHRSRRRNRILAAWLIFVGAIVAIVLGSTNESLVVLIPVGVLMVLAALIMAVLISSIVSPKKIDNYYVWLKGVNPDYLAQLPPVHG